MPPAQTAHLFPSVDDIEPSISREEAHAALAALWQESAQNRADVYMRPNHRSWNVWLPDTVVAGGQRLELNDWVQEHFLDLLPVSISSESPFPHEVPTLPMPSPVLYTPNDVLDAQTRSLRHLFKAIGIYIDALRACLPVFRWWWIPTFLCIVEVIAIAVVAIIRWELPTAVIDWYVFAEAFGLLVLGIGFARNAPRKIRRFTRISYTVVSIAAFVQALPLLLLVLEHFIKGH